MSNYLNSLVARQLDRESLVQPRLPSLFEPPAFTGLPHALGAADSRAPIEPVAPGKLPTVEHIEAEHIVAVRPEAGSPVKPRSGSRSSFSSSPDETPGTEWRGRQNMESIASSPAELTPDQPHEVAPPVTAPQAQGATSTTITPRSLVSPETSPVPRQNIPPSPAHLIQTTINEMVSDETKGGVESKRDPRIVQPRVVLPNENRRAGNNSVMPGPLPTSEPAPVINVTIGRIEVRASTPTTPPRKQPSAKPLMSLDEYLQRRMRGGGV
jgi:hypothetical protein